MTKENTIAQKYNIDKRIRAIVTAMSRLKDMEYATEHLTLSFMLAELEEKLSHLSGNKEYMITFEKGGWNTIFGHDDEEALKNAKEKYDGGEYTKVRSVSLSSPQAVEAAMRTFY